jgi:DNA-binding transcriptional regulator LsrR (DeoR family)
MTDRQELRLIAKVARMYYEQDLGQTEIAQRLDLSQATVSRLLKRALDERIVQISVNLPSGFNAELEDALQVAYGLKEVIIADAAPDDDDEQIQRALGTAAAFYVQNTIKAHEVIGLSSWSATLLAMVDAMRPFPRSVDAQIVQILGGIGNPNAKVHANRLTERFAQLLHGRSTFLPAPGVVGSEETAQVIAEDVFVKEAMVLFDHVTLALVGIGTVEPSKLLASSGNRFSAEELDQLRAIGAVGDICMRFFDRSGTPIVNTLNRRVIGMTLEQLRHVKRSVGIAGGLRKYDAIRGAMLGKWINVLITDRIVAEKLIAER